MFLKQKPRILNTYAPISLKKFYDKNKDIILKFMNNPKFERKIGTKSLVKIVINKEDFVLFENGVLLSLREKYSKKMIKYSDYSCAVFSYDKGIDIRVIENVKIKSLFLFDTGLINEEILLSILRADHVEMIKDILLHKILNFFIYEKDEQLPENVFSLPISHLLDFSKEKTYYYYSRLSLGKVIREEINNFLRGLSEEDLCVILRDKKLDKEVDISFLSIFQISRTLLKMQI